MTKAAGAPEGLAYVSCENEQARPSSFTAYLFMIDPDSHGYAIVRLIGSSKATALAHGSDASKTLRGGSAINHITGVCAGGGAGASTTLTMEVNGRTLAQTTDPRGIGPFDAVGLGVISRAQSGAEFDFDNLVLKKVTGPGTPTPAGAAESTGPSATG